jgi:mono/diheme cytochrome c family protein
VPIGLLGLIAGLAACHVGADDDVQRGAALFYANCAACHGPHAEGDGPACRALAVPVPDLTTIAVRHDGFPAESLREVIDGRREMVAHGSRSMPVWGEEFTLAAGADEAAADEAAARIEALLAWLESVQD